MKPFRISRPAGFSPSTSCSELGYDRPVPAALSPGALGEDGNEPHPNSQPQRGDKDAPTGRMARSLTQREDWTRDLGGCLTSPGGNQPQRPRYG